MNLEGNIPVGLLLKYAFYRAWVCVCVCEHALLCVCYCRTVIMYICDLCNMYIMLYAYGSGLGFLEWVFVGCTVLMFLYFQLVGGNLSLWTYMIFLVEIVQRHL